MRFRAAVIALVVGLGLGWLTPTATASPAGPSQARETVTITVTSAAGVLSTLSTGGPIGENLLCDKFYAFADEGGEFTLQHRCGGNTIPWGYRIAPQLRAIAASPVAERGVDWTKNGVIQKRLSPHVEAVDYIFHGTFPDTPDGTVITYTDHYSFRHDVSGGGEVNIDVKGAFTATGNRA